MAKKGRRKAMTENEIDELKQKVAVTTKGSRPFVFTQPTAPGKEFQKSITLTAMIVFGGKQYLTPLASEEY